MTCPHCIGIEKVFNRREAERELRRYQKKGPAKTTRALVEALLNEPVTGRSLLDIGAGVGSIVHQVLAAGASQAQIVEASSAYLEVARREAERRGAIERVRFVHGDFVRLAPDVPPADIVTLDRVICCYPDMRALVSRSAERARQLYGAVYPRDVWWVKVALRLLNAAMWLMRNPFRTFVHPTAAIEAVLREHGLSRRFVRRLGMWEVSLFARVSP